MILNDIEIRKRITDYRNYAMSRPLIEPFSEKRLQGASYDVSITNEVAFICNIHDIIDIKYQNQIDASYEKFTVGSEGFLVYPKTYMLVTLKETFYIPHELTAHLRPKTRFIRLGLFISGQHINPESICKLNIGIFNATDNPIRLYPNISIAQIVFEQMIASPSSNKLYKTKNDAHYSNDIEFIGAKTADEFQAVVDREINKLLNLEKDSI